MIGDVDMLEELFPVSYKARNVFFLVLIILAYIFIPIFVGIVGSSASAIPYVSSVIVLLDVIVSVYSVGGITVALLFFFGRIN